jgi:hypothetical protein
VAGFGLQTLTNDMPVALSAAPATNGFHFQEVTNGGSAIAVTPRSGNFDLDVSTNTSLTPKIAMSQQAGTNFDYALFNGHGRPASGALYAQVYGATAGSYLVESEWTIPDLQIGQFYEGPHLGTNESVDLFEVNLTALENSYITLARAATNAGWRVDSPIGCCGISPAPRIRPRSHSPRLPTAPCSTASWSSRDLPSP